MPSPVLTATEFSLLMQQQGERIISLDLGRSTQTVHVSGDSFEFDGRQYPILRDCRDRTIYAWTGEDFEPAARFSGSLIKLVPTQWGAPTFEISGIKMLPSATVSPFEDARRKVALIEPAGKTILDTCGGLGYFAACCIEAGARRIESWEKNADVIWLRTLNPWSPIVNAPLELNHGDISVQIASMPSGSFDAILHDPPRFGIAGELYSQAFYNDLARVLRPRGKLFHYTGTPNKLTSGRDVPNEVSKRLRVAGFDTRIVGDGVLCTRR